jgi:hypothetical protein
MERPQQLRILRCANRRVKQLQRTCYSPPCQALVQQGCQLLLTGYLHLSSTCGVNTCCAWHSTLQLLHTISGCRPAVPFVSSHWWCCEDSLLSNVLRVHQHPPPYTHTFNVHASPRISLDGKVVCIATTNTSRPSGSSSTSKQAPHPLTVDLHHTHMHLHRVSCVSLAHSVVLQANSLQPNTYSNSGSITRAALQLPDGSRKQNDLAVC